MQITVAKRRPACALRCRPAAMRRPPSSRPPRSTYIIRRRSAHNMICRTVCKPIRSVDLQTTRQTMPSSISNRIHAVDQPATQLSTKPRAKSLIISHTTVSRANWTPVHNCPPTYHRPKRLLSCTRLR